MGVASRLSWEMKSITRSNEISDLFDRFGRQVRPAGSASRLSRQVGPAGSAGLLCWASMLETITIVIEMNSITSFAGVEIIIIARKTGVMEAITIVIVMKNITFKRKHFSMQHSVHYSDHDVLSLFIEK